MKLTMNYHKSTKNTHVFEQVLLEDGETLSIPSLYVKKEAFPGKVPITIEVTVEVVE